MKKALVTGASRGIGAAIAKRLVADGVYVIGTATSEIGCNNIDAELGEGGESATLRLENSEELSATVDTILGKHSDIGIVVANAGITRDNLFMRMSAADWADVLNTNLLSLHQLVKPFIRGLMRERWGRIVTVSSVVARAGNPGQTNYVASKAGIEGFTRSLAAEIGSRGITVNCVAPGFIATDMTSDLNEKQTQAMLDRIPLGRMGTASEVANVVAFLASEQSDYITGQTIHVNGGMFPA